MGFYTALFSLLVNAILLITIAFMLSGDLASPDVLQKAIQSEAVDSYAFAVQIGRFDVVTLLLAVLAIVLAVGAVGWGTIVWRQASFIAHKTAQDETATYVKNYIQTAGKEVIAEALIEWLSKPENRDLALSPQMSENDISEMFKANEGGASD